MHFHLCVGFALVHDRGASLDPKVNESARQAKAIIGTVVIVPNLLVPDVVAQRQLDGTACMAHSQVPQVKVRRAGSDKKR